eukprot:TRINITY_DN83_c0_g1_i1.p1 TRINITY_DN83_c0_g1~~TRINITY_DN83_c0_g1_i1.p1  ORF type:complete len:108 (-),score=26.43 TRINITY_DN83_c0_g1_i1:172-495(-)
MASLLQLHLLLLPQSVQCTVGVALVAHEAGESEGGVVAGEDPALIHVPNVQLHRRMVLGRDQAVGGGALPRDVEIDEFTVIVLHAVLSVGRKEEGQQRERRKGERRE